MNTARCRVMVFALAGLLPLAACSGETQQPADGESGGWEVVADTPEPVGGLDTVTWAVRNEPESIDINRRGGTGEATVVANICDRLLQLQPDLSVRPSLASAVDQPDPTTWVYTLRDDVTFHDGSALSAEDVVWSLRRNAEPGMEDAEIFQQVESIEATGPREVTVRLARPDAMFNNGMADDAGVIMNRELVERLGDDYGTPGNPDACAGPYQLESWDAGSSLTLARDDDYWNDEMRPMTETIEFVFAEGNALANGLKTGEIDGVYRDEPDIAAALGDHGGIDVYFGKSTAVTSLLPTDSGPMTDPRLRRALSLAIDREGIAQAAFHGLARPWKEPVGPGAWGYQQQVFQQTYDALDGPPAAPSAEDIEEATTLVEEAGAPDDPIVVASRGDPVQTVVANAVQAAGESIGLRMQVETVSPQQYGGFFGDGGEEARQGFDLIAETWWISTADPLGFYDNAVSDASNNWVGYSDPDYDQTAAAAFQEVDDAARAELVTELATAFHDDTVWIPLTYVPNTLIMSSDVTGPPPGGTAFKFYPWAAELGAAQR